MSKQVGQQCAKCGSGRINTIYMEEVTFSHRRKSWCRCDNKDEHLHYRCKNCNYEWDGPTRDQQREQATIPPEGGDR